MHQFIGHCLSLKILVILQLTYLFSLINMDFKKRINLCCTISTSLSSNPSYFKNLLLCYSLPLPSMSFKRSTRTSHICFTPSPFKLTPPFPSFLKLVIVTSYLTYYFISWAACFILNEYVFFVQFSSGSS